MSKDMTEAEEVVDEDGSLSSIFEAPDGFYRQPDPARWVEHKLLSGDTFRLRLVGQGPMWAHHIWNGALAISRHLEENPDLIKSDTTVLELGAAAGLPSLTAAYLGAAKVVVTDYPDQDIIENLGENVKANQTVISQRRSGDNSAARKVDKNPEISVLPHLWGSDTAPLTAEIEAIPAPANSDGKFTLILMADLLYNHSSHPGLLNTLKSMLSRTDPATKALIFFTPYRPWLWEKDVAFLDLCREAGLKVEKILETDAGRVMFEDDAGDREMRSKIWGWQVTWPKSEDSETTEDVRKV